MARKTKTGLDYFSHDVNMIGDRKIRLLRAKHGLLGYAIFLRLLEEAYKEFGYYLEINKEFNLLFCDDNNIDLTVFENVINDCIDFDLFDKKTYENFSILTSKRMQQNFFEAAGRRKKIQIYKEYLLLNFNDVNINLENVSVNSLNANINSLNANISTQRKEKKRKENSANAECEHFFEKCWSLYPNKKGKSAVTLKAKKEAYRLNECFIKAINGYKKEIERNKTEEKFIKHGSTFWNSGYKDYLPKAEAPKVKKPEPEMVFYDIDTGEYL